MKRALPFAALAACLMIAACNKAEAPAAAAVTEEEAGKAFDATVAAWSSMDAAKIKAVYAPDVVGYDYSKPALVTDRATWDSYQDAFAGAKYDSITVSEKKIQLLGPGAFVVSSTSEVKSSSVPKNNAGIRCTDIFKRQSDGKWLIANENCSAPPKAG